MFDLFINLIESYIIARFYSHSINLKECITFRKSIVIICIINFLVISIMNYIVFFEGLGSTIYIVIDIIYLSLISKNKISSILSLSLICNIFTSVANQSALILVSSISDQSIATLFTINNLVIIATILSKLLFATICFFVVKITAEMDEIINKYSIVFIIVFSLAFLIILFFQKAIYQSEYNYNELIRSSYFLLIMTVLLIWLAYKINDDGNNVLDRTILESQLSKMKEQFKLYEVSNQEISILRHDMKNILLIIDSSLKAGEIDKVRKYLSKMNETIDKNKSMIITSNIAVDCVLNSYMSVIKEKNIEFITNINKACLNYIDEIDLAVILANLISNAIENIAYNYPFLEIIISCSQNNMHIKVCNSVEMNILMTNPDLITTKEDKKLHGFGIKSVMSIAEKYSGIVHYHQSGDIFICSVEIPMHKE